MLMPAAVGLGLIDSFVCESPLATTDSNTHGPEIEYLTHGVTGLVSHADELAYARMVAATLADPVALVALKAGCRRAAVEFSLDGMVDRFAAGILACLAPPQSAC